MPFGYGSGAGQVRVLHFSGPIRSLPNWGRVKFGSGHIQHLVHVKFGSGSNRSTLLYGSRSGRPGLDGCESLSGQMQSGLEPDHYRVVPCQDRANPGLVKTGSYRPIQISS